MNAVKAFYTEYGRYPLASKAVRDFTFADDNADLMDILRGVSKPAALAENPRKIVFIEIPGAENNRSGLLDDGTFVDPWGFPYRIRIDADYDSRVKNPSPKPKTDPFITTGVIAWSWGKDGKRGESGERQNGDIFSWQ